MIKATILPTDSGIKIRHMKKHARTKIVSAVMLGHVTMGKSAVGNLTGEFAEAITWEGIELPEAIKSKFRTARYDDGAFESESGFYDAETLDKVTRARAMVAVENNFYYMP